MKYQKRMDIYVTELQQNEKLLRTALKKRGLHTGLENYEDYLQIARLAFLEGCQAFEKNSGTLTAKNQQDWLPFLYCVVNRRLLTEQKRSLTQQQRFKEQFGELWQRQTEFQNNDYPDQYLIENEFWQNFWPTLTKQEGQYLVDWAVHEQSVSQIARQHAWSRQKVYRLRKAILNKLNDFQEKNAGLPDTLAIQLDSKHVSNPRSL